MSEIEKKTKEISEKWKTKFKSEKIEDMYKFYRKNQVELFEDLEKLSLLCKLEELKQVQ